MNTLHADGWRALPPTFKAIVPGTQALAAAQAPGPGAGPAEIGAALFPHRVANLILTVTPLDFHADARQPDASSGCMNLWACALDDERKLPGFLRLERWIADRPDSPGEYVRQWFKDLVQGNKLIAGALELGGRKVDLRAITVPVLDIGAEGDAVIPNGCTLGHGKPFGSKDDSELGVPGGQIGTLVGAKAQGILAPAIVDGLVKRRPTR